MDNFFAFFGSSVSVISINFWRMLECEPKKLLLGVILSVFWETSASGWGNVKNDACGCASGWGNVKNLFQNVLLAGEMFKKINVLLAGETLKNGMCFWLGKYQQKNNMLLAGDFFCASGWGNSKKIKNVKSGGNYVFVSRVCTNIVPPTFNILTFL